MSIKLKSALFALVFTPILATAAQFPVAEEDPTYSRLYPSHTATEQMNVDEKVMADINRTIDMSPTAAGSKGTTSISDYYGVGFDVEHSAN